MLLFTYDVIILPVVIIGQNIAVITAAQSRRQCEEVIGRGQVKRDHGDPGNDNMIRENGQESLTLNPESFCGNVIF